MRLSSAFAGCRAAGGREQSTSNVGREDNGGVGCWSKTKRECNGYIVSPVITFRLLYRSWDVCPF